MKLVDLERELKKFPVKRVYLLVSSESYLRDAALSSLIRAIQKDTVDGEIEKNVFSARDTSAEEIVNHALTYPFLCALRLIVVKNFDAALKEDFSIYEEYFSDPADCSILILTADKVDARLRVIRQAKTSGFLYQFDLPKEWEIPGLIKREFSVRYGKQMDDEGSLLLSELIGMNLDSMYSELEKLDLYIGNRSQATIEDVAKLVGHTAVINTFRMSDALSLKDAKKALSMLLQLLNQSQEAPELLIGGLKWHFNRLYAIKKALSLGKTISDAFKEFKVFHSQQDTVQQQVNTFTLDQLSGIYQSLYITERKMKSTGENPQILLERFFFKTLLA
ncbi:MAG: DNA polymerase III subunit delta [Candidatus Auribacterota bacterium]|jgi:DNA polymerase-3 subunit delta|nr:DNA polymerase III subunit delta [Candidatus Auribacterota bacterium]